MSCGQNPKTLGVNPFVGRLCRNASALTMMRPGRANSVPSHDAADFRRCVRTPSRAGFLARDARNRGTPASPRTCLPGQRWAIRRKLLQALKKDQCQKRRTGVSAAHGKRWGFDALKICKPAQIPNSPLAVVPRPPFSVPAPMERLSTPAGT